MRDYILNEDGYSNCCSATVIENTERCSECGENCVVVKEDSDEYRHLTSSQKAIQKRYE